MGNEQKHWKVKLDTCFWRDDILYVRYFDFAINGRNDIIEQYVEEEDVGGNLRLVQVGGI